jgi:hypothetical protein
MFHIWASAQQHPIGFGSGTGGTHPQTIRIRACSAASTAAGRGVGGFVARRCLLRLHRGQPRCRRLRGAAAASFLAPPSPALRRRWPTPRIPRYRAGPITARTPRIGVRRVLPAPHWAGYRDCPAERRLPARPLCEISIPTRISGLKPRLSFRIGCFKLHPRACLIPVGQIKVKLVPNHASLVEFIKEASSHLLMTIPFSVPSRPESLGTIEWLRIFHWPLDLPNLLMTWPATNLIWGRPLYHGRPPLWCRRSKLTVSYEPHLLSTNSCRFSTATQSDEKVRWRREFCRWLRVESEGGHWELMSTSWTSSLFFSFSTNLPRSYGPVGPFILLTILWVVWIGENYRKRGLREGTSTIMLASYNLLFFQMEILKEKH